MRDLDAPDGEQMPDRVTDARLRGLQAALRLSGSKVETHKALILVDLQGIYLSLHKWLSAHGFVLDDAFIISRFAYFQLRRTFDEIARRVSSFKIGPCGYLNDFFDTISVEEHQGEFFLSDSANILKNGTYIDLHPSFEIFYAPAPLRELAWQLRGKWQRDYAASSQNLTKVEAGIIEKAGVFKRDYSKYNEFVRELQRLSDYKESHKGFFNFSVEKGQIKYFDEKEVDTRIVMRAMDAIHASEFNSLCIVSSDQDFLPLCDRSNGAGIYFFQADLAKFTEGDRVGRRLREMGDQFIQGGIDPTWPLEIITEAMSCQAVNQKASYGLDDRELDALVNLHNEMNDVKMEIIVDSNDGVSIKLRRPL